MFGPGEVLRAMPTRRRRRRRRERDVPAGIKSAGAARVQGAAGKMREQHGARKVVEEEQEVKSGVCAETWTQGLLEH